MTSNHNPFDPPMAHGPAGHFPGHSQSQPGYGNALP